MAMSLSVFFLLSPNPGAFTAQICSPTFNLNDIEKYKSCNKWLNFNKMQKRNSYQNKQDMCLWNTDAPGGNKVEIWQKSL